MTQHTPGPWTKRWSGHNQYIIDGNGVDALAVGVDEADACLIAAAPDLLEALEYVMIAHGEQLHDAFDMAHKAIAKANAPILSSHSKDAAG